MNTFNIYSIFKATVIIVVVFISPFCFASNLAFGLFGDLYMTSEHQGYMKSMLADMVTKGSTLAISSGGIKPANQACTDENLLASYPVFAAAPLPVFYIPGDAEWTLCSKNSNGGYAADERLNLLRRNFYQSNRSLGQPSLPLSRQAGYPEHMQWQSGPAMFVTLTVPSETSGDSKSNEITLRNIASLDWLKSAFNEARRLEIGMLVIIVHREIPFDNPDVKSDVEPSPLTELLQKESISFQGQILFVHGGNGVHRIDHPLIDSSTEQPIQNFTRVETYGALQQGWVQVRIVENSKSDGDPVHKNEFVFESFPWPPLETGSDEQVPVTMPSE